MSIFLLLEAFYKYRVRKDLCGVLCVSFLCCHGKGPQLQLYRAGLTWATAFCLWVRSKLFLRDLPQLFWESLFSVVPGVGSWLLFALLSLAF